MMRFLRNMEIRTVFQLMTGLIILLLLSITTLGIRQYLLYRHCDHVVDRSSELLFQFTSIKEHINEALLGHGHLDVQEISREIRGFDKELKTIINDILIPEEFKLSFISQIDLVGLVVQLRSIQEEGGRQEEVQRLNRSLRSISGRFLRFHELLSEYTNTLLLGLHKVIVGTLALVVFIMSSMLFLVHRSLAEPMLRLSRSALAALRGAGDQGGAGGTSMERLEEVINRLLREKIILTNMLHCLENSRQTLTVEMTDQERWETLCQALLTNPEYIIAWVGLVDEDHTFPQPVAGCGCLAHAPLECRQLLRYLRKFCRQAGSLCTTAIKAVESGQPSMGTVSLQGIPELANASLPFDPDQVACASFPVTDQGHCLGVVTICASDPECFGPLQVALLNLLMQQVLQARLRDRAGGTLSMETMTRLYQFSVIGALAADVAHEMSNIANGSLNCSQALLDLAQETQRQEEETRLLQRLHAEEEKMSQLSASLHRLAGQTSAEEDRVRLDKLLPDTLRIIRGQLKRERIDVRIDLDEHLPELTLETTKLQVVLLTLLQKVRDCLPDRDSRPRHQIIVHGCRHPRDPGRVIIRIDNCPPGMDMETVHQNPWPSLAFCRELIRSMGGELHTEETTDTTGICIITLALT